MLKKRETTNNKTLIK